jgi:hypothetical protein
MTPEERLTKIENAIQALIETQARHENAIEKQNAGIRDLIVVSRTLLETANAHNGTMTALAESQNRTDEKLKALIDTVREHEGKIDALVDTLDKIIRKDGRKS